MQTITKTMHSAMDLRKEITTANEPKRSFNGFPVISNNNTSSTNSITRNNNNDTPPDANLLAPRPLRRCRSASPVPQRQHHQQQTTHANANGVQHSQLLSVEQQAMIRKSWLKISKATFGTVVFEKMIERSPGIERLFNSADPQAIGRHERYFADLAQWAVDGMAEPEKMLGGWLEMIGRGHGQFNVKRAHWDYMGEALAEAVCQSTATINGRQRREIVHAWRVLLSFLTDRLGCPAPGQSDPFNRIHLLQLVSNGPPKISQTEEKERKTPP